MEDIKILPFNESHVDGVVTVSMLSFPVSWSKSSMEDEVNNKFARYIVAICNDTIVGFAGTWIILDEAHITNIAVHPEYRGCSIGSRLMEALLAVAKLEGATSSTLEVRASNMVAQNLYKKYGFVTEGSRKHYYEDNKEDAIIMWKRDL
jgi:ribosomal-protein-alanine N-acetyltransferase